MIAYRRGNIAVFLHGFSIADQDHLDAEEIMASKKAARSIFALDPAEIAKALRTIVGMEVGHRDQKIQK